MVILIIAFLRFYFLLDLLALAYSGSFYWILINLLVVSITSTFSLLFYVETYIIQGNTPNNLTLQLNQQATLSCSIQYSYPYSHSVSRI